MKRRYTTLVPLLIVALAYLLRTATLDWQSFWLDEAHAIYFIDRSLGDAIRTVISPNHNGPLYFLNLWAWHRLAGPSDFAIRYLSTIYSVLTVAVVWRLARIWFGRRVAGWTGLLLAISPFAIWFAQETKMYAMHMFLASLATLFLVQALHAGGDAAGERRWPYWLAYGITLNLLGYSHFFGAFTVAAQGLLVLLTTWNRPRKLLHYATTMALVALPYLPVANFALSILSQFQLHDISKGFVPLDAMLREMGSEFSLRTTMLQVAHPVRLLVPVAALLALGTAEAWRRGWRSALWMTGLLWLPTLIFYPISFKVPVFSPKYLSASFPYFVMTVALSIEALRRFWKPLAWAGLALVVGTAGWAHLRSLTDPFYQRAAWRETAAYLESHVRPDDAVVVFADYVSRPLGRYYDGPAPLYRFKAKPYEPEEYYADLRQRGHHTLWLVLHQDQAMAPHNRLREGAGLMFPAITGLYPNNGQIAVLGHSIDWRHDELPDYATPVAAPFENGLALVGYHIDAHALPPNDDLMHPPSNWIHVTTFWQRTGEPPAADAFTPFVRLVDTGGGVWGGELQRPPTVFHFDPPTNWGESDVVEAHYDVNLNPVTPPGSYTLVAGLFDADGEVIPLQDGAPQVVLTPIEVTE